MEAPKKLDNEQIKNQIKQVNDKIFNYNNEVQNKIYIIEETIKQ